MKSPSKERGCDGKANIGSSYERAAEILAHKHGKRYGVYRCPHCGGHHLTTKLDKRGEYAPLLYVTSKSEVHDLLAAVHGGKEERANDEGADGT